MDARTGAGADGGTDRVDPRVGPLNARLFAVALLACALGACAVGNRYDYDDAHGRVAYTGANRRVAVAAWEQRPYVLSGHKAANFVGLQRARMGIPFDVVTASRQPLAVEMGDALARTLDNAGFGAAAQTLPARGTEGSAVYALLRNKPWRAVLLRVDEWKSDTYNNPAVFYDLTLNVYDGAGRVLATARERGSEDLKGRLLDPMGKAKQTVPDAFRRRLEALLGAPQVAAALR